MTISPTSTHEEVLNASGVVIDILCRFLISGTNKVPYRNITQDMIDELTPILEDNFTFIELVEMFGGIMREVSEGKETEGK